jgi:hypothetical protein
MKLASLKGGRDGRLVVVSNDLAWFTDAGTIAPTLQAALDDWERCGPMLKALAESVEHGGCRWSASMSTRPPARCPAPTSGSTARPM